MLFGGKMFVSLFLSVSLSDQLITADLKGKVPMTSH